jgi:hypothetical protein
MFVIKITNDEPDDCELWGPYETRDMTRDVIAAYVEQPESCEIIEATEEMEYAITGKPL